MKSKQNKGGSNTYRPDWKKSRDRRPKTYPQFKRVCFHRRPHADEVLAWMMLFTKAGKFTFPNLDPNNIVFVTDNTTDYHLRPDCLHIGCGGDPRFDEHVGGSSYESACTLMAKALGLIHNPKWVNTLEHVRREDRKGKATQGEIAWVMKEMYRYLYYCDNSNVESEKQVMIWASEAYWAEIESESSVRDRPLTAKKATELLRAAGFPKVEWFESLYKTALQYNDLLLEAAKTYFSSGKAIPLEVNHHQYGVLKLYVVKSGNQKMSVPCWKAGGDILVLRNTQNDHTAIMTNYNNGKPINFSDTLIRLREDETVEGADWIPVGEGCTLLLNGSPTHPDVKGSGLSVEQIVEILRETLG